MITGRFHLRWWHWLLVSVTVLLLLVSAAVLGLRLHGEQRYAEVTQALRTSGKLVDFTQLAQALTPVDEPLMEQWHRWAATAPEYPPSTSSFPYETWNRFITGQEALPDDTRRRIEDVRSAMQPARDLLANDHLRIGYANDLHLLAPPDKRTLVEFNAISRRHISAFLASRYLAQWLAHEAATASDPRPSLKDLDRLTQRFRPPLSLLDAMMLTSVHETRDQAYRAIALQGRLADDLRSSWVSEPPAAYDWIASSFDIEQVVSTDLVAKHFLTMTWSTAAFSSDPVGFGGDPWTPMQIINGTWMWCTGLHDCATMAEVNAHVSARLRRERLDPPSATSDSRTQFIIARISLPSLLSATTSCVKTAASHRIERLAVRLLTDAPRLGLPADEAGLLARYGSQVLAPVDDLVALRYEYLASDRFRLAIDPATPVPNFAEAAMVHGWARSFGQPASTLPLVRQHADLEIQLPAALFRP